jgi:hypothetical protein
MASYRKIFHATPTGSLHKALGVPAGKKIPVRLLLKAMKWKRTKKDRLLAAKAALVYRFAMKRRMA